jgi:hypothetical protein
MDKRSCRRVAAGCYRSVAPDLSPERLGDLRRRLATRNPSEKVAPRDQSNSQASYQPIIVGCDVSPRARIVVPRASKSIGDAIVYAQLFCSQLPLSIVQCCEEDEWHAPGGQFVQTFEQLEANIAEYNENRNRSFMTIVSDQDLEPTS